MCPQIKYFAVHTEYGSIKSVAILYLIWIDLDTDACIL